MVKKTELRRGLLAARRAVPADVRRRESRALVRGLDDAVAGAETVCAYWPVGTEPGSGELVDRLAVLCETVLLPVIAADGGPLRWGRYEPDALTDGRFGLREPAGATLEPDALAGAGVVLVPALAVDRTGVRLGRGGGFYDRSLVFCAPGTRLVAVVRDEELRPAGTVPCEPHDVRMTHALTPSGLVALTG